MQQGNQMRLTDVKKEKNGGKRKQETGGGKGNQKQKSGRKVQKIRERWLITEMARPSYIWRVRVCFACFSLLFFLFPFLFCLLSCCGPQKSDRRSGERRGGWDLHVGYISPTYRITLGVQLLVQRVRMRGELCYSADYKLCRTGWLFEPPATF